MQSEIDTSKAHSARVYDYWLGGKNNFGPDRELAENIVRAIPTMRLMARANRDFLGRAVRFLVQEAGIRQFLDIGTGLPTVANTHEVAQGIAPESRVVYVDNDPIVLVHARALMSSHPAGRTDYVQADLRDPAAILALPALARTLDLNQPVALMLVAILMLLKDEEQPDRIVSTLTDALPSGSYVAISHPTADFNADEMSQAVAAATYAGVTLVPRTQAEVERFFAGLELVDPGVVPVLAWRPELQMPGALVPVGSEHAADARSAYYWAGVGRKP